MESIDRQKSRRAIAVARTTKGDRQLVDIITLSLIGLIFVVVEITQHAGTGMLRAMFAQ
jgi:hypothetical protein